MSGNEVATDLAAMAKEFWVMKGHDDYWGELQNRLIQLREKYENVPSVRDWAKHMLMANFEFFEKKYNGLHFTDVNIFDGIVQKEKER